MVERFFRDITTQRLRNGELVLRTAQIAPLAAQRYQLAPASEVAGKPASLPEKSAAKASGNVLENDQLRLRLDETTGGIVELRLSGLDANLADTDSGHEARPVAVLVICATARSVTRSRRSPSACQCRCWPWSSRAIACSRPSSGAPR